jgi:RHS repeat-associated protein
MQRRYVPGQGVDETLVWYEGADLSSPHWLHTDQQGSVIAATDNSATATPYAYSVTGEPKGGWSSSAPAFRYTGQVAIASAAIYYYKARMYDPALGRFLQTDPVGYQAGMNLYAYVGNDSMNATDASGLCADPENSTVDCTDQVESVTDTGIRLWNDTLLTDMARIVDRALQSPIFRFSIDEKQRQSIANGTNGISQRNGPKPPSHDEGDPDYNRDLNQCRALADSGNRAAASRCYGSAELRKRLRDNGTPESELPPLIAWRNGPPVITPRQAGQAAGAASGAALLYWIISEGSRLFPPRNLIPVP